LREFRSEGSNLGIQEFGAREETNPLLNPLLEQNLARWAQVYFATPPAGRDEAVRDLLRQLRVEINSGTTTRTAEVSPVAVSSVSPPASHTQGSSSAAQAGVNVCLSCHSENSPDQQFCGFCGFPLDYGTQINHARTPDPVTPEPIPPRPKAPPANSAAHGETFSFLGLDPHESDSDRASPNEANNDLQFLREKSFGSEYYEPESHRGRYVIAAIVIILAGITYVEWPMLRTHLPWVSQATARLLGTGAQPRAAQQPALPVPNEVQPPVSQQTQPPVASPPGPASSEPEGTTADKMNAGKTTADENSDDESRDTDQSVPPARPLTLASRTEGVGMHPDGTQELQLAQRYLDGRGVPQRWPRRCYGRQWASRMPGLTFCWPICIFGAMA
jgi:hypothetical protein